MKIFLVSYIFYTRFRKVAIYYTLENKIIHRSFRYGIHKFCAQSQRIYTNIYACSTNGCLINYYNRRICTTNLHVCVTLQTVTIGQKHTFSICIQSDSHTPKVYSNKLNWPSRLCTNIVNSLYIYLLFYIQCIQC